MLLDTLLAVRRRSEALIAPLEPEDLMLQGMADASPPKWHLGHTTWFFDTFVLQPNAPEHQACDPLWSYQFNSYYEAIGARHPRPQRGLLSRPPIGAVLAWRQRVDAGLEKLLMDPPEGAMALVELGLQHEGVKEPGGVAQMPFGRACIGHPLEHQVFRFQRRDKGFAAAPHRQQSVQQHGPGQSCLDPRGYCRPSVPSAHRRG